MTINHSISYHSLNWIIISHPTITNHSLDEILTNHPTITIYSLNWIIINHHSITYDYLIQIIVNAAPIEIPINLVIPATSYALYYWDSKPTRNHN